MRGRLRLILTSGTVAILTAMAVRVAWGETGAAQTASSPLIGYAISIVTGALSGTAVLAFGYGRMKEKVEGIAKAQTEAVSIQLCRAHHRSVERRFKYLVQTALQNSDAIHDIDVTLAAVADKFGALPDPNLLRRNEVSDQQRRVDLAAAFAASEDEDELDDE